MIKLILPGFSRIRFGGTFKMPVRRLTFTGDFTDEVAAEVIEFAQSKGLVLESAPSGQLATHVSWTLEEMEQLDLAELVLPRHYRPPSQGPDFFKESKERIQRRESAIGQIRRLGGQTVADLTRRTFGQFVETYHALEKGANWELGSAILAFMLKNGLSFRDTDPADILKTPTLESGLRVYIQNMLAREDIMWIELLQFVTKDDLLDIRNFGEKTLDAVTGKLRELGLVLKDS